MRTKRFINGLDIYFYIRFSHPPKSGKSYAYHETHSQKGIFLRWKTRLVPHCATASRQITFQQIPCRK